MKYAVIRSGGKQYRVSEGNILEVDRIQSGDKKDITFEEVLLYASDGTVKIGSPKLEGVTVTGSILGQTKGEKIRVSKYKAKVRFRRVVGFRASLTKVQITAITTKGEKKETLVKESAKSSKPQAKRAVKKKTS